MEAKFVENFKEILEIKDRNLQLTDRFREYEEWDSLAYLSLIAMIDEEYDVIIEGKDFKELSTVGEIIDTIKSRMM